MATEAHKTRIVATDQLGNKAYIYCRDSSWRCVLHNGTPASFFYAGIREEMPCKFALEDANTALEVMAAVQKYGSSRYYYAFVTP